MNSRALFAGMALATSDCSFAAQNQFNHDGMLKIGAGSARAARLHIACSPDRDGGALSIELIVPEANVRKDFDYDDFEGPDAAARDKDFSHITWTSAAGVVSITHAASGWYAPEPAESFMFGVSQPSHGREAPAQLLGSMSAEPGKLVWTQTGFDDAKGQLVATFEFDTAAAKRLRDSAAPCLPAK